MHRREVDVGPRYLVEHVGEEVLCNECDDFDDVRIAIASTADGLDVSVADVTSLARDLARKDNRGIRLRGRPPTAEIGEAMRQPLIAQIM